MREQLVSTRTRPVAIWLLVGVFMIMVQVLLGGITRLTGSGLSITDWAPIMGAIPPLNHADWLEVFHKYQQTPQSQLLNSHFMLSDFKSIFFWEWFHRFWGRMLGVVFMIPFFIFLAQKRFTRGMTKPMIILFLLGALQGVVGWIMVKSGLVDNNIKVNHIKLTIHFMAAMVLFCYTVWFALKVLIKDGQKTVAPRLWNFTLFILVVLTIQLIYGGFMAGLRASLAAHTWPDINGMIIPTSMLSLSPALVDLTTNSITVQFIHRGLAYMLIIFVAIWWWQARKTQKDKLFYRLCWLPIAVVLLQVLLGILTVINSHLHIPVELATAHQFVGMLLLGVIFVMFFLIRKKQAS